jgi:hypothetical protein
MSDPNYGFSMLQEDIKARRDFSIVQLEDKTFGLTIVTQWKDEPTPVISKLKFSKLGLIMLQNMVTEALTNMEAHCVSTKRP